MAEVTGFEDRQHPRLIIPNFLSPHECKVRLVSSFRFSYSMPCLCISVFYTHMPCYVYLFIISIIPLCILICVMMCTVKELEFIHKSNSTVGYRPNVFSTTLSHLIATNSSHFIIPFIPIRGEVPHQRKIASNFLFFFFFFLFRS